jgi:predicted RNA-binding Zn ribbon-like protein
MASRSPATLTVDAGVSLNDLLWVANTAHGPGGHWHARPKAGDPTHDHLADPGAARAYLADHGVPVPDAEPDDAAIRALRTIRSVIERLADDAPEPWTPDALALLEATTFRLDPPRSLRPTATGWPSTIAELLIALVSLVADDPGLGRCENASCRLVFVDGSRNGRRRWCDPGGCGNRSRVGRARRRERETAAEATSAASA